MARFLSLPNFKRSITFKDFSTGGHAQKIENLRIDYREITVFKNHSKRLILQHV